MSAKTTVTTLRASRAGSGAASEAPQDMQKRATSGFGVEQTGQATIRSLEGGSVPRRRLVPVDMPRRHLVEWGLADPSRTFPCAPASRRSRRCSMPTSDPPGKDMAWIPGGAFRMGSDEFYPEERPVHDVAVDGFWMDDHQVTVAEFRRFVKATGHVTVAERAAEPADYPDADPDLLVPGSLVFRKTADRSTSTTTGTGGARCPGPSGGTRRARQRPDGARPAPGHPRRLRGRDGVRALGRQGTADRGRVGVRRARRARWRGLHLGRRVRARRAG